MKIAYLCHVDWGWIKQRPQFIAEGLAGKNDVDFYYFSCSDVKKRVVDNEKLRLNRLFKFPFSGRSKVIKKTQIIFNTEIIRNKNYDLLWVCSPEILARVDVLSLSTPIIYDCMDDMIESHSIEKYKSMLMDYERSLLGRSTYVFVSSNNLRKKMLERGCDDGKIDVVYNATKLNSLLSRNIVKKNKKKNKFILTYFGTISNWIDLDLIYKILDDSDLNNVHIQLIGPSEVDLKNHPRLEYIPPVPHDMLATYTSETDLFILPFLLNDITLSVDPVKLYEYIALHRNIAAIYYPELERYSEFVNFYRDFDEFKKLILGLQKCCDLTYGTSRADQFVSENTWAKRVEIISDKLNSISVVGEISG